MKEHDLIVKFRSISNATDKEIFNVINIENMSHYLGKTIEGYPCFFISNNGDSNIALNIDREFLSVEYSISCLLKNEQGCIEEKQYYTMITLRTLEAILQNYFIDIFSMMLSKMPSNPSKHELSICIENLITIFSALNKPPKKKIQGLWAEMFVIYDANNPTALIESWHSQPNAKYDFTMGQAKIEVKSTSSEERIHRFSLNQLNPSPSSSLLIASVTVRESANSSTGLSVLDLYDKICERVEHIEARTRLYRVMAETIGNDFAKLNDIYFDIVEAIDSLAFFDYHLVPKIDKKNVPEHVSEVKFHSNLSHIPDILESDINREILNHPLYKSLFNTI